MINRISDPFFSHSDSGRKLCDTPIGYSPELSSREDRRVLQILDRIQYALRGTLVLYADICYFIKDAIYQ